MLLSIVDPVSLEEPPPPELVFYDLTSTFFHGAGPGIAEHGVSKDKRPDKVQIVLGVVMADGIPIAHEVWSGNTVDKSTLEETVEQMKDRLEIGKMVFVADRGVISAPNFEELEDVGYKYILSTKRRKDNLAEKLLVRSVPGCCGMCKTVLKLSKNRIIAFFSSSKINGF